MELIGELKQIKDKALISGDKGIELLFYIIANDDKSIDLNKLHTFLHKPVKIEITNG